MGSKEGEQQSLVIRKLKKSEARAYWATAVNLFDTVLNELLKEWKGSNQREAFHHRQCECGLGTDIIYFDKRGLLPARR